MKAGRLVAAALVLLLAAGCEPGPPTSRVTYAIGDSLTSGLGGFSYLDELELEAADVGWPGAGFAHRGLAGKTLPEGVAYYLATHGPPELAVVVAGINDAIYEEPLEDVIGGARRLDELLRSVGSEVLWVSPPSASDGAVAYRLNWIRHVLELEVRLVDCTTPLGIPIRPEFTTDGIHLTAAGARALAACIDRHLEKGRS